MTHTREDYLNGECTHREYYAQFVTPSIRQTVKSAIGEARLLASTVAHFNDVELSLWDRLAPITTRPSLSEAVCVLKEAAQQIVEETTK